MNATTFHCSVFSRVMGVQGGAVTLELQFITLEEKKKFQTQIFQATRV